MIRPYLNMFHLYLFPAESVCWAKRASSWVECGGRGGDKEWDSRGPKGDLKSSSHLARYLLSMFTYIYIHRLLSMNLNFNQKLSTYLNWIDTWFYQYSQFKTKISFSNHNDFEKKNNQASSWLYPLASVVVLIDFPIRMKRRRKKEEEGA